VQNVVDISPVEWRFYHGDLFASLAYLRSEDGAESTEFDYYFIDSDHTEDFATRYTATLFDAHPADKPLHGSVHDVHTFKTIYHGNLIEPPDPSLEGAVVYDWIQFTPRQHEHKRTWDICQLRHMDFYVHVMRIRSRLGIATRGDADNVRACQFDGCINSMMFFDIV
jgi:hypothetical protein